MKEFIKELFMGFAVGIEIPQDTQQLIQNVHKQTYSYLSGPIFQEFGAVSISNSSGAKIGLTGAFNHPLGRSTVRLLGQEKYDAALWQGKESLKSFYECLKSCTKSYEQIYHSIVEALFKGSSEAISNLTT